MGNFLDNGATLIQQCRVCEGLRVVKLFCQGKTVMANIL